eukprot:5695343-Amphidinium_carterae.2
MMYDDLRATEQRRKEEEMNHVAEVKRMAPEEHHIGSTIPIKEWVKQYPKSIYVPMSHDLATAIIRTFQF